MEPGSFRPAEATAAVSLIVQAEPIVLRGHRQHRKGHA
jgi:hypothetical protein